MPKKTTKYLTKAIRCPDGTRKYIRGKTQEELDRKVREAQAQLGMGININDNTTVAELAQIWVDVYKRPNVKPQTLTNTLVHLNKHILPYIGGMKVRDVKPADCARVMAKNGDLCRGVQSAVLTTLRSLFNCAIENNIIAKSPVTPSIKCSGQRAEAKVPLTSAQTTALCQRAMRSRNKKLYTFIMLCCYAGLRRGEAVGLNLKNVDLDAGVIRVREQYTIVGGKGSVTTELKTKSAMRDVPIPPILLAHLTQLKGDRTEGYIFDVDKPGTSESLAASVRKLCGIGEDGNPNPNAGKDPLDFYVHPHLLRHTYATRCFEAGMDVKEVQYLLGHSSPNMTMNIYVHYMAQARQEDTARKLEKVFSEPILAVVGQ